MQDLAGSSRRGRGVVGWVTHVGERQCPGLFSIAQHHPAPGPIQPTLLQSQERPPPDARPSELTGAAEVTAWALHQHK